MQNNQAVETWIIASATAFSLVMVLLVFVCYLSRVQRRQPAADQTRDVRNNPMDENLLDETPAPPPSPRERSDIFTSPPHAAASPESISSLSVDSSGALHYHRPRSPRRPAGETLTPNRRY